MKPRIAAAWSDFVRGLGVNFGFLVFMLLFVAGIGLSTGYTVYRLREKAIDEHFRIGALHARAIEDHLTQSFNVVDQTLANAGEDAAELPPARLARRFEAALLTSPALRSISLLDAGGRIVVSSNPADVGVVLDVGDFLPRHGEDSAVPRIGRPRQGRDFGDVRPAAARADPGFIPVLRAVRAGRQRLTLAAAVNPGYFIDHYGARLRGEEGFVEVLRYDGVRLMSTGPSSAGAAAHDAFIAGIGDVESGSLAQTLDDGTALLTSFRASRSHPLIVVAHMRRDYALDEWAAESRRLLSIVAPALFAVVLLTSVLFVRLRRVEEQQSEARSREQDRLAATVFRTVDSGVLVADGGGRIVAVNPAFTRITGYAEDEAIGRRWTMLAAHENPPECLGAISCALADGGSWHGEIWHRRRGGDRYIAWQSVNPVRGEDGAALYHVMAFSDITDRKQAEEAQLRAVLEASPEAVLLVEADGRISYANRVCERMFGYTPEEAAGLDVGALVPASKRGRHRDYIAAFAREPHSRPMGSGIQLAALRRDGGEFPVEISLSPISLGGRLVVIASIGDITERKAAEHKLMAAKDAAEKALERAYLAEHRILDISERTRERIGQELHDDLGQHLTGAAFLSEILFRKLEAMKQAEREDAAAITRLINDAVAKTRTLAQGLYPVELKEAGLRSMIEQLARNVERTCDVACEVRADADFAVADAGIAINLFRMAQEAINNAVRHGKAGRVVVAMRRTATADVLEVEDDGKGFDSLDAATDKGGLGMHTMRYRAGLIGAELRIAAAPGGGARVVIALPLSEGIHDDAIQRTA